MDSSYQYNDNNQMRVGNFLVALDGATTCHVSVLSPEIDIDLRAIAEEIRSKFPETSHIGFKDISGHQFIEVDWTEMEYNWNDHMQEIQDRVITVLEGCNK